MAQATLGLARPLASVPVPGRAEEPCRSSHPPDPAAHRLEAFLVSTAVVGLAEIGDKTQILSLVLAARFRRPLPVIAGIFCATAANHALAGLAGRFFGGLLHGPWLHWILGISFFGVAVWALFPDQLEGRPSSRYGAFLTTLGAFFLAEIGDKTQIATIGLAARFDAFTPVVIGTVLGMMLANVPVVLVGDRAAGRLPLRAIRITAAAVYAVLGVMTLLG